MQTDIKLPSHLPDAFSSAIGLLGDPFRVMIDGKPRYYSPCWSTGIRTRHNAPMTSAYRRGAAFIDWFIRSDYMQSREFGSSSDMWIDDSDRAQRCWDAASDGCDGSTHQEHIEDWRSAAREYFAEHYGWSGHGRFEDAVWLYLDELEQWHEMNGTLWQQIN